MMENTLGLELLVSLTGFARSLQEPLRKKRWHAESPIDALKPLKMDSLEAGRSAGMDGDKVRRPGLWITLNLILVALAYSEILDGPFVWDDHSLIEDQEIVRDLQPFSTYFTRSFWSRPLTLTALLIERVRRSDPVDETHETARLELLQIGLCASIREKLPLLTDAPFEARCRPLPPNLNAKLLSQAHSP